MNSKIFLFVAVAGLAMTSLTGCESDEVVTSTTETTQTSVTRPTVTTETRTIEE